ncbi:MAG TPA: cytochrome C oxidase subunit IV family protein [Thermoanaerobaculia bacterium]|jgi:caa(3)-type oxidase, subunit IV|nr:cytochrome C oxidase subunit IV family protein [Thermoanaerobaculia bacterium]
MAEHVSSPILYVVIFALLMVLTFLTVFVAYFDFGVLNDVVALTIAMSKALLVVLFFMHVKYSTRLTALTAASGLVFLAILIGFTLNDYLTRGDLLPVFGK